MCQPLGIGREQDNQGRTCTECGAPLEVAFADYVTMQGRKIRLKDDKAVCPMGHLRPQTVRNTA